jgi:site-specific DNA recombinase
VTEVSRLTRDPEEAYLRIRPLVRTTPFRWVETTESDLYDLADNDGWSAFIKEVFEGSQESGKVSRRITRNNSEAASQGRYHGGQKPYGYEGPEHDEFGRVTNTGRVGIVPVEHEAAIIRESIVRIRDNWPLHSIVRDLNDRRIPNPTGDLWRPGGLRQILTNERIAAFEGDDLSHGTLVYKGSKHKAQWPAIVSRQHWEEAQLILSAQQRMKGATKKGVRSYLLTGYVYCGNCNKLLIARRKSQQDGGTRRYVCTPVNSHLMPHGCGHLTRMAEPVELWVADQVLERFSSPSFAEELRRAYQDETANDELSLLLDEAQGYSLRLGELEQAWKKGNKNLDLDTMLRLKADLKEALNEVDAKMDKLTIGRMLSAVVTGEGVYEAWDEMDLDQRRVLIALVVNWVKLYPGQGGRKAWKHKRTGKVFNFNTNLVKVDFKF